MKQFKFLVLFAVLTIVSVSGCGRRDTGEEAVEGSVLDYSGLSIEEEDYEYGSRVMPAREEIYENLALLGKVWGFVKYTHLSFITGQLDWDEELLALVPLVLEGGDVRAILYDWFVGLGDSGYGNTVEHDEALRQVADLSWLDYGYLGPLAAHLQRFDGIATEVRDGAPMFFNAFGIPNFSNQNVLNPPAMRFARPEYRLLGLFRVWNAVKYFFPHHHALDVEWNEKLTEFVPMMLEGTDRLSYMATLQKLSHHLQDGIVQFFEMPFFEETFGRYVAPVQLVAAEGRLVVYYVPHGNVELQRGDVILTVNGRDIEEIIQELRPFISYPKENRVLACIAGIWLWEAGTGYVRSHALRSHTHGIYIEVLRGVFGTTLRVLGSTTHRVFHPQTMEPYVILDYNIGLINHSMHEDVRQIMQSLADTDGIIVDFRGLRHTMLGPVMREYLMEEPLPENKMSFPALSFPGMFTDTILFNPFEENQYTFNFDRPVVFLMDEQSNGLTERVIMLLRAAPNVTVIGENSIGSGGIHATLPVPGGFFMIFKCMGLYTLDGGQTFRVGLAPDIRVERTVAGIREGRDEIMDAAIAFILGNLN